MDSHQTSKQNIRNKVKSEIKSKEEKPVNQRQTRYLTRTQRMKENNKYPTQPILQKRQSFNSTNNSTNSLHASEMNDIQEQMKFQSCCYCSKQFSKKKLQQHKQQCCNIKQNDQIGRTRRRKQFRNNKIKQNSRQRLSTIGNDQMQNNQNFQNIRTTQFNNSDITSQISDINSLSQQQQFTQGFQAPRQNPSQNRSQSNQHTQPPTYYSVTNQRSIFDSYMMEDRDNFWRLHFITLFRIIRNNQAIQHQYGHSQHTHVHPRVGHLRPSSQLPSLLLRIQNINSTQNQQLKGLKKEEIDRLKNKKCKGTNGDQNQNCPICYCDIEKDHIVKNIPCKHSFHSQCLSKWLIVNTTCPLCKFDIAKALRRDRSRVTRSSNTRNDVQELELRIFQRRPFTRIPFTRIAFDDIEDQII